MPHKRISQKEARELKKQLYVAETKLSNWCSYNQPGVFVGAENITTGNTARMRMARKLGYGLLIVPRAEQDAADIYAVKG